MDQMTLALKMMGTLEQIQKASQGDSETLKLVCRFAVESVRTDIRQIEDEAIQADLRTRASEIMRELRD